MLQSILEQPDAISRLIDRDLKAEAFVRIFGDRGVRKVWIVGSGTSLYAAMIAAQSWERELGLDCEAISSLEFLDQTETGGLGPDVMVLAISQSGASLILLEGMRRAAAKGAITVVVTAHPEAPIPLEAEFVIETYTGPEVNMGKTKGFTTTAVGAVLLGRRLALGSDPEAAAQLRARYQRLPESFAQTIESSRASAGAWVNRFRSTDALYVVGAGTQVPTALEGALKILEVAKMPVVPKELEEMMHGPMNGVGPKAGIILLAEQIAQEDRMHAFVEGVSLVGVSLLKVAASPAVATAGGSFDLVLPQCDDAAMRAILGVIPMQVLAHDLASARGVPIDTARYPELYPVFASKSIHKRTRDE